LINCGVEKYQSENYEAKYKREYYNKDFLFIFHIYSGKESFILRNYIKIITERKLYLKLINWGSWLDAIRNFIVHY